VASYYIIGRPQGDPCNADPDAPESPQRALVHGGNGTGRQGQHVVARVGIPVNQKQAAEIEIMFQMPRTRSAIRQSLQKWLAVELSNEGTVFPFQIQITGIRKADPDGHAQDLAPSTLIVDYEVLSVEGISTFKLISL